MMFLVNGASATLRKYADNPMFGHLATPRRIYVSGINADKKPWGADNDCFGGLTAEREHAFSLMLRKIAEECDTTTLKFVAAPDEVGDAVRTTMLYDSWHLLIHGWGLPAALVGQDGLEELEVPWQHMEALFIGGTTTWKVSSAVDDLIEEAKKRGKWVHVGRVNTRKRIQHFFEVGVDSVDGTCLSRWPDTYFPTFASWLTSIKSQPNLWG